MLLDNAVSYPYQPAEWEEHEACWLAWPSAEDLWQEDLGPARKEFIALCRAISGIDYPGPRPVEKLEVLVPDARNLAYAQTALQGLPVTFHEVPFGDIWLRDTGPIFTWGKDGKVHTSRFAFNGWGGKYSLAYDDAVSAAIAKITRLPGQSFPWILEGGSVDVDGNGTCLTTRQCLLNQNRNKALSQSEIEGGLKSALGVTKVVWLQDGLLNDHTDGHIDTIARFVAPGKVLCMRSAGADDPNTKVLETIMNDLSQATDAQGRKIEVLTVPSPGRVTDSTGKVLAASYVNFYIANRTVVVPNYDVPNDAIAVKAIADLFPQHKVVGSSAKAILTGGGAFHCITQQQPKPAKEQR